MPISLKRAYDDAAPDDGYRVLVDGIWPRGISKENAKLHAWKREIAPSKELRRRFHDGSLLWGDFRRRYLSELKNHRDALRVLAKRAKDENVTLVFGSADQEHNNAVVLKHYLEMLKVS